MVRIITPLLFAIPVFSQLIPSHSTLSGLVARQSIDPSDLPSACQSSCQVVNTMESCNESLTCLCTNNIGSQLQECMTCLANAEPTVESSAQSALSSWNSACNGNLSLGGGSSSSSSGSSATSSSSSPTSTATSGGSGGASNPLHTNNAAGLDSTGMAAYVVAALFGAFISL